MTGRRMLIEGTVFGAVVLKFSILENKSSFPIESRTASFNEGSSLELREIS
jgi:hypothetical protein